jgi:hypothetical protein
MACTPPSGHGIAAVPMNMPSFTSASCPGYRRDLSILRQMNGDGSPVVLLNLHGIAADVLNRAPRSLLDWRWWGIALPPCILIGFLAW